MGEDEDIDVESDDDDLDTKAEHGMFIDQKNTKKSLVYDRNQVFGLGPKPTPKTKCSFRPDIKTNQIHQIVHSIAFAFLLLNYMDKCWTSR